MHFLLHTFIALLGAVVGSFLNVCIHRLPEGRSLFSPPSSCPDCGHPIRPCDNIPVVSYALLRGRCRHCGRRISPRYPVIELLTAAMAVLLFRRYGLSPQGLAAFAFTAALIVVTFVDLRHGIIPDAVTLPGIPLFLGLAVFVMGLSFRDALLGAALGGGIFFLLALGYRFFTKREGMGGGDIKLLAMLGAFFGWQSLCFILLVSSLLGALAGTGLVIAGKKELRAAVPFGPFLSLAAVAYLFFGPAVTAWLLQQ